MPEEPQNAGKKLYVDEDWKSQVEAEKDAVRNAADEPPAPPKTESRGPMPPADLSFLVGSLYVQAAIALGLMPNPMTRKAETRLDQAKHAIDLLEVLQKKTEGNRTQEETDELEGILYELRMTFVTVSGRPTTPS